MTRLVAIDPGVGGAIASYFTNGKVKVFDMPKTPKEITDLLYTGSDVLAGRTAYIEHIQTRENDKLHVSSAMKLMKNYGGCLYACYAYDMHVNIIQPSVWMSGMIPTCLSYADRKKRLWEVAKKLFPDLKFKKSQADALCLLRYAIVKERVDYDG